MFQFIESFKIQDKTVPYLDWHQKRIDETFYKFYRGTKPIQLKEVLTNYVLPIIRSKARLLYNEDTFKFSVEAYKPKEIRTLEVKEINGFDYSYKFFDRSVIQRLKETSKADDILMHQNGKLVDFSYANIALFKNENWFTPTTYLLNGTARQRLIENQQIESIDISVNDLMAFDCISPINALLELGEIKIPLKKDLLIFP